MPEDFVPPPARLARDRGRARDDQPYIPRVANYPELEASNRVLGVEGERWVLGFEQRRLARHGREDLAARIEWTAHDKGDGYGFDIRSYEPDGREILVEVKTTRMGLRWPFIVTRNELRVSQQERERYHVYRVFRFRREVGVFRLAGAIDQSCSLEPKTYVAQAG